MQQMQVERAEWCQQGRGNFWVYCVFTAAPEKPWPRPMWHEVIKTSDSSGPPMDAIRDGLAAMCQQVSRDYLGRKDDAAEAELLRLALEKLKPVDTGRVHILP